MELFLEDVEHVHDLFYFVLMLLKYADLAVYLVNFLPVLVVQIAIQTEAEHCNLNFVLQDLVFQ